MNLYQLLKLAASLVFAAPPAIVGVDYLARGELPFGVAFLALAVLMLALPEFVERRLGARMRAKLAGLRAKLAAIPLLGRRFRG